MFLLVNEIQIGDKIAEQDGFLWDVTCVERNDKVTNLTLHSDYSSYKDHWHGQKGVKLEMINDQYLSGIKGVA